MEKHTEVRDVSCLSGQSCLNKRQTTAQLTIFADGKKLKPLIILAKGCELTRRKKISGTNEYRSFSNRMSGATRYGKIGGIILQTLPTPGSSGKRLVVGVHKAKETPLLSRCKNFSCEQPRVNLLYSDFKCLHKQTIQRRSETPIEKNTLEKT